MSSASSAPNAAKGKSGQNRRRMDEALVQNSEHHVDDEDRENEEREQPLLARLERLRRSREARGDRRRNRRAPRQPARRRSASPSATPGLVLNEIVTDGKLTRVRDRERPDVLRQRRHGAERNQLALARAHVQHSQRVDVLLKLWLQLHHDQVLVVRRVDRRYLPRSIRVVERALDLLLALRRAIAARSRSMSTFTCGLVICRSLVTSWICGMLTHPRFHLLRGRIEQRRCLALCSVN